MFLTNEALDQLTNTIFAQTTELDRGDIIPLEMIEEASGFGRYTESWSHLIIKLKRKMLADRAIALWSVRTIGYKLCTKDEQLNMTAEKRQRKAIRQLSRSLREVGALEPGELSIHMQHVRSIRLRDMLATRRLLKRQLRQQKSEARRTQTIPSVAASRRPAEAVLQAP